MAIKWQSVFDCNSLFTTVLTQRFRILSDSGIAKGSKSKFFVGNSVVAFEGVVLLGTTLLFLENQISLSWSIQLPSAPDVLVIPRITTLIVVSLYFAVASVIKRMQQSVPKKNHRR